MKTYVDWAAKRGFAVIDVNLPKHVADTMDGQEHEPSDDPILRTQEAIMLLTYLWDNYIELSDATHVFLMGTNIGHGAITGWIKGHEDIAYESVTGAISFVKDVPLQSCKSATDDGLAVWYYRHSQVFVEHEHGFWNTEVAKKPKKRFGKVERSEKESITEMLIEHKDAVFELLSSATADWKEPAAANDDDTMDTGNFEPVATLKSKMPPVGNFALSPRPHPSSQTSVSSPKGRSSRRESPTKTPPVSNFAQTARQRSSRSPVK